MMNNTTIKEITGVIIIMATILLFGALCLATSASSLQEFNFLMCKFNGETDQTCYKLYYTYDN